MQAATKLVLEPIFDADSVPRLRSADIDGSGGSQPVTNGILVLRYDSGPRGQALIAGAVARPRHV